MTKNNLTLCTMRVCWRDQSTKSSSLPVRKPGRCKTRRPHNCGASSICCSFCNREKNPGQEEEEASDICWGMSIWILNINCCSHHIFVKGCVWRVGCFSKDTLKKNKKPNPVRNWGAPRENISRRREWSNKSRGLLNTLKVWRKIVGICGRRGIDDGCDTDYQVLKAVFLVHCPDSVFHNLDKPETYNLKSRTI